MAVFLDFRLFVFGGSNGTDVFNDLYVLDLASNSYLPTVSFTLGA